jgi:hypothetical protein
MAELLRVAIEQCLKCLDAAGPYSASAAQACLGFSSGALEGCKLCAEGCLGVDAIKADAVRFRHEVDAMRLRAEADALDAEAARRQLRRMQVLCANSLYDVRQRSMMRLCFQALQHHAPAGRGHGAGSSSTMRGWPGGLAPRRKLPGEASRPSSVSSSLRNSPVRTAMSPTRAADSRRASRAPAAAERLSLPESIGGSLAHNLASASHGGGSSDALASAATAASASLGTCGDFGDFGATPSHAAGLGDYGTFGDPPGPAASAAGTTAAGTGTARRGLPSDEEAFAAYAASRRAVAAYEAEEVHQEKIARLLSQLSSRRARVLSLTLRVRKHALLRQCVHAWRGVAAESIAWRGVRAGVMLAARAATRHVARAAFVAWKLIATRSVEERERTAAISAVVTERLAAAEGHFASLLAKQLSTAAALKARLAGQVVRRSELRMLALCWHGLRLWAAHHRLLGERQAWRDLLLELQTDPNRAQMLGPHAVQEQVQRGQAALRKLLQATEKETHSPPPAPSHRLEPPPPPLPLPQPEPYRALAHNRRIPPLLVPEPPPGLAVGGEEQELERVAVIDAMGGGGAVANGIGPPARGKHAPDVDADGEGMHVPLVSRVVVAAAVPTGGDPYVLQQLPSESLPAVGMEAAAPAEASLPRARLLPPVTTRPDETLLSIIRTSARVRAAALSSPLYTAPTPYTPMGAFTCGAPLGALSSRASEAAWPSQQPLGDRQPPQRAQPLPSRPRTARAPPAPPAEGIRAGPPAQGIRADS